MRQQISRHRDLCHICFLWLRVGLVYCMSYVVYFYARSSKMFLAFFRVCSVYRLLRSAAVVIRVCRGAQRKNWLTYVVRGRWDWTMNRFILTSSQSAIIRRVLSSDYNRPTATLSVPPTPTTIWHTRYSPVLLTLQKYQLSLLDPRDGNVL